MNIITDHKSKIYLSINNMCNAYKIPLYIYEERIKAGWSIKDALETEPYPDRGVIDHLKNKYKTVKDMCDAYNISQSTFSKRVYQEGFKLESALSLANSKELKTKPERAYKCSFWFNSFSDNGSTKYPELLNAEGNKYMDYIDIEYDTLEDMCEAYDVDIKDFCNRYDRGVGLMNSLNAAKGNTCINPNKILVTKNEDAESIAYCTEVSNIIAFGMDDANIRYKEMLIKRAEEERQEEIRRQQRRQEEEAERIRKQKEREEAMKREMERRKYLEEQRKKEMRLQMKIKAEKEFEEEKSKMQYDFRHDNRAVINSHYELMSSRKLEWILNATVSDIGEDILDDLVDDMSYIIISEYKYYIMGEFLDVRKYNYEKEKSFILNRLCYHLYGPHAITITKGEVYLKTRPWRSHLLYELNDILYESLLDKMNTRRGYNLYTLIMEYFCINIADHIDESESLNLFRNSEKHTYTKDDFYTVLMIRLLNITMSLFDSNFDFDGYGKYRMTTDILLRNVANELNYQLD